MAELTDEQIAAQIKEACKWLDRAVQEMEKRGYTYELMCSVDYGRPELIRPIKFKFWKTIYQ